MEKDALFARLTAMFPGAKKTTLREMLESRRVLINGVFAKSLKQPLGEKDKLEVLTTAEKGGSGGKAGRATILAQGLRVIFFDSDLVVVDKPSGLLTSTDAAERRPTAWRILSEWISRQNHKNKVHLIHRLDRDASGLLVFARNWEAYSSLKKQFFEHTVTRQYDALVNGIPKKPAGHLENLLVEDQRGVVRVTQDTKMGKLAILDYETIEVNKARKIAHLRCTLFTGRKHQIRVQLLAAGHAVCGDGVYGIGPRTPPAVLPGEPPQVPAPVPPPGRLALHASHLSLEHPRSGKRVSFDSRMPGSFVHLMST